MRKDIAAIADKLIPSVSSIKRRQEQYVTDDIINEVLLKHQEARQQVKAFAPYLKGATVKETCYNVWKFWRSHIKYMADDARGGKQIIKSPAAVWADKFCDCKSFSVAVNSCLHYLGIDGVFRFVSFNEGTKTIPTHVYNVAKYHGEEIIIDCCLPQFDMEKSYAAKYDYLQPGLYSVTGVGKGGFLQKLAKVPFGAAASLFKSKKRKRGELRLQNVQTHAELGLVIHEQRVELEQDIAARVHGIGSTLDNNYQIELAAINNAICDIGNPALVAERCRCMVKPATSYIGKPLDRQYPEVGDNDKRKKRQQQRQQKPKNVAKEKKKTQLAIKKNTAGKAVNKKDAKRLEKMNIVVAKKKEGLLKKITNVLTAPVRLVQKGLIEIQLPKAAPAFLYLFLKPEVLAKAPEIVKQKYNKAKQYADRVVNKVKMKQDHFTGIVRNGIMKQMGDTPENILSQWMNQAGFRIGFISSIIEAGQALGQLLGGKAAQLMQDAPAPEDWETAAQDVREQIHTQAHNTSPTTGGGMVPVKTEEQMYNDNYDYSNADIPTGETNNWNTDDDVEGKWGYEGKTLDNVIVKSGKRKTDTSEPDTNDAGNEESGGGNGLLIAAAVAAVLLFSGGGKKKKAA